MLGFKCRFSRPGDVGELRVGGARKFGAAPHRAEAVQGGVRVCLELRAGGVV